VAWKLETEKFEVSKSPFYTTLIIFFCISFMAQLDNHQQVKKLASLAADLLGESITITTYTFFLNLSLACIGLAGFGYSRRHVPVGPIFSKFLGYFVVGFLGTSGVLLGWGYGVLAHAASIGSASNILEGVGIISLFSLFILVPVFMVLFYLTEVNKAREPQPFNKNFNITAFKWLSLALFVVGIFGFLNMVI
jgi:hypothetical protein